MVNEENKKQDNTVVSVDEKQEIIANDEIINDIETEEPQEYKNDFQARVWQLNWQVDKGATEEKIRTVYERHKDSIIKFAYILHDKDKLPGGEDKKPHYHVVFTTKPNKVSTVTNWWGFKKGFVRVCTGKDSFNSVLVYFTHKAYKNNIEKQHYSIENIKQLGEQLDIETIIMYRLENKNPKKRQTLLQSLKEKLLQGEISYNQIRKDYPDIFVNHIKKFQEINQERIKLLPIPEERINIYITGAGGAGKDFLTDLLSYWLTSKEEFEIDTDNERVYTAGGAKVALQEYNGQECICFRDYRAGNLLEAFGGRGGLFGAFDTTPRKTALNIKYGSVMLKNKYSIVNSVQTFEEFSDAICKLSDTEIEAIKENERDKKRYESKLQTLRRWAFVIHILDNGILIKINNNFLYPNAYQNEYTTYVLNNINLRNAIEEIKHDATSGTQEEIFKLTLNYFPCLVYYIKEALQTHSFNRKPNKENSILGQLASNISIGMYQEYSTSNLNNNIVQDSNVNNVYQMKGENTNDNNGTNTECTSKESISIPDATSCE